MADDLVPDQLATIPLTQLRRVAEGQSNVEPVDVGRWRRYGYENGAGDSAVWFFDDERWSQDGQERVLLLTFDHESELSVYPDWDIPTQLSFFAGLPESMLALVQGPDVEEDDLVLVMSGDAGAVVAATGVFFYDEGRWQITPGLARHMTENGHTLSRTGIDFLVPKRKP